MNPPVYPWQNSAGQKVTFSTYSVSSMMVAAWGSEWAERDIVYEFSNGRCMEDSLKGPYAVSGE